MMNRIRIKDNINNPMWIKDSRRSSRKCNNKLSHKLHTRLRARIRSDPWSNLAIDGANDVDELTRGQNTGLRQDKCPTDDR